MSRQWIRCAMAAGLMTVAGAGLAAQASRTEQTTTAATTTSPAVATTTVVAATDSRETREAFQAVLEQLPPEVATVLKLDPSLFANASYLSTYPALADFVSRHPEIAHNPSYFLESVPNPRAARETNPTFRMWRDILGDIGGFLIFLVFMSVLIWLIRTMIEQRRWSRLSRIQVEVQNKLLDRFTANEELLAYIQSPAARRFLESAPIPLEAGPRPISAPIGKIFWSLQTGLVTAAAGVGLMIASFRLPPGGAEGVFSIAVLALCVGVAFILSAGVFYLMSRRFALWPPAPPSPNGESVS